MIRRSGWPAIPKGSATLDETIVSEAEELCGCYIDEKRGVLKVTDISPKDYPAHLKFLPEGAYHIYDYQFFYRNLQENVANRIKIFNKSYH